MRRHWQPYATALALVCTVLVSVAAAYASYQYEETQNFALGFYSDSEVFIAKPDPDSVAASKSEVLPAGHSRSQWALLSNSSTGNFLPADTWSSVTPGAQKTYVLDFALTNATSNASYCKSDKLVRFELFVTAGAGAANAFTPTLTCGDTTYTAAAETVTKDSVLYYQYGDGYVYSFCNAAGQEMSWTLAGGGPRDIDFTLTVKGSPVADTGIYLMAVADEGEYREVVMPTLATTAAEN